MLLAEGDSPFRLTQAGTRADQLPDRLVRCRVDRDRLFVECDRLSELVAGVTLEQVAVLQQRLRAARLPNRAFVERLGRLVVLFVAERLIALEQLSLIHP